MSRKQQKPQGWYYKPGSPEIRGFDTSALFREDCLERNRHLQAEIDADMRELARMKKEHAATEERLRKLKKELRWIE